LKGVTACTATDADFADTIVSIDFSCLPYDRAGKEQFRGLPDFYGCGGFAIPAIGYCDVVNPGG
jgi:hypothetical protein